MTRTQLNEDTSELGNTSVHLSENREAASINNSEELDINVSPPRAHPYNLRSRTRTS
jgi:hypothetical protein